MASGSAEVVHVCVAQLPFFNASLVKTLIEGEERCGGGALDLRGGSLLGVFEGVPGTPALHLKEVTGVTGSRSHLLEDGGVVGAEGVVAFVACSGRGGDARCGEDKMAAKRERGREPCQSRDM